MKILMINKFFYIKGGSEVYMFDLRDLLKDNGHQIVDFSMQDEKNFESDSKEYFIENIDFNKREGIFKDVKKIFHLFYSFEAQQKLEALIKKEKPDIAHIHNFSFQLTPAIIYTLKKHKIPIVWTMHDYKLVCPSYRLFTQGQACERCKVYKYYNCFNYKCLKDSSAFSFLGMLEAYLHNWILKSYDKINVFISPSKFLKNKVEEWGTNPSKTKHVYNFIKVDKFEPNYEPGNDLLFFGRLSAEKGLFIALEAMKDLPNIKLKIIGNGPEKQAVEEFIKEHKLQNIELLGYKSGQELYDLIRNSRYVIMPSIWYENNPIAALEAFALGKPVIGSNLGGIPELVQEGKTGYLFEPGDVEGLKQAILIHYDQLDDIKKLGQNARIFVQNNCSPEKHLEQISQVYKNLIK